MSQYSIPNLKNACRVMQLLPAQADGLTIVELTQRLDVPRTTMLRILTTLQEEGFVRRSGKQYQAGANMLQVGLTALRGSNLRVLAAPVLKALSYATGETAHVAQLAGHQMLILEVCESPNPVRAASRAGTMADIHCSGTGKVMLANVVEDVPAFLEGVELTQRTENTITTIPELLQELALTKERGYGIDDVEYVAGVRCLAAPVYDGIGEVVAAIGITASIVTFTRSRIDEVAANVTAAARELSNALGAV